MPIYAKIPAMGLVVGIMVLALSVLFNLGVGAKIGALMMIMGAGGVATAAIWDM